MCIKIVFVTYYLLSIFVDSTYIDQSQLGDLNVQVDLKGLHIIALMKGGKEEYVDYDYAYDYSEMTIKPQNRTTPRPLNITSTIGTPDSVKNATIATTVIFETTTLSTQVSDTADITSEQTVNFDNSTIKNIPTDYNVTSPPALTQNATPIETVAVPTSNATTTSSVCKKGFVQNSKGECELKMQEAGNALLKLVKLSQKLKLRRENKSAMVDSD